MSKLTGWFNGDVKPIRAGVYERPNKAGWVYSFYDGHVWAISSESPELAYADRGIESNYQNKPWRGLANKPSWE